MDNVAGLASGANFEGVIRIEEEKIRSHVDQVVRETVEQTLNGLLQAEADAIAAQQYTCCACAILPDHAHLVIRRHRDRAEEMISQLKEASRLRLSN